MKSSFVIKSFVMKRATFVSVVICLVTAVSAQNTPDRVTIRKIIQQQQDAWNRHDWAAFSSYYADDATLINFIGQIWEGKNSILEHFNLLSGCCLEPTSLNFEVKNFRSLTPDLMIVYIEETLYADRDYTVPIRQYKKGDVDYKWRIDVFVRKNKDWRVLSTQMTLINQVITPHQAAENSSNKR